MRTRTDLQARGPWQSQANSTNNTQLFPIDHQRPITVVQLL